MNFCLIHFIFSLFVLICAVRWEIQNGLDVSFEDFCKCAILSVIPIFNIYMLYILMDMRYKFSTLVMFKGKKRVDKND